MANKKVTLAKPFELHGKMIAEIELREPTGGMLLEFGEPLIASRTKDGAEFCVEDREAVVRYLDGCVVHDNGADILRLASLSDVRKVKEALFSFFDTAGATSA